MRRPSQLVAMTGIVALLPAAAQAQMAATGSVGTDQGTVGPLNETEIDRRLNGRTLGGAAPYGTPISDDRIYAHGIFNQLEGRLNGDTYLRWEGQAWIGNDYNKLWLKSEARYNTDNKHQVSDGDQELLYDRAISRFYNIQAGVRYGSHLRSRPF